MTWLTLGANRLRSIDALAGLTGLESLSLTDNLLDFGEDSAARRVVTELQRGGTHVEFLPQQDYTIFSKPPGSE